MKEVWKVVDGSGGDYLISNYGRVKSLKSINPIILKERVSRDGYVWYVLQIDKKPKTMRANRLVAMAFIDNPLNKPTVNHIDGNKKNNFVGNLEWATKSEQMQHAYKNGLKLPIRGMLQGRHVLTETQVKEIRRVYKGHDKKFGMFPLAKKYNVSVSTINKCVGRRSYKNVK